MVVYALGDLQIMFYISLNAGWEGSDDWVRLQMRTYLLSLMATLRTGLKEAVNDFNEAFVSDWRISNNYRVWSSGDYPDLASAVPGYVYLCVFLFNQSFSSVLTFQRMGEGKLSLYFL